MGSLYGKTVVDTALSQIGYEAGSGKWNKYADDLDKVDYFTGCGKKQGEDWCCVFVCWCVYMNTLPKPDKWDAHYFLYQSDSCDTAAVVKYAAQFYKDHGAYDTDTKYATKGDQIFFKKSNGTLYHTGIVVDWDDKGIYTVEGNTNGGKVAKKFYSYGDSKIAGFGHPRYDAWEEKPVPTPEPQPTPTPKPDPQPIPVWDGLYQVKTNGGSLSLRSKPNTSSEILADMPNGTILKVDEIVIGETIKGNDHWCLTTYKGQKGYGSGYYIYKLANNTYEMYTCKTNTGDALRIRMSPKTSSVQIGYIPYGRVCKVYSIKDGWAKVEYDGTKGYSYAKYLKKV